MLRRKRRRKPTPHPQAPSTPPPHSHSYREFTGGYNGEFVIVMWCTDESCSHARVTLCGTKRTIDVNKSEITS